MYLDIADIYLVKNDVNSALKYYEKAAEYAPQIIKVHINYAKALLQIEDYKNALRKIRKAYSMDRTHAGVLLVYGAILLQMGNSEDALSKFNSILENSDMKEAKLGKIEALHKLKRLEEAVDELENAKNEFQYSPEFLKLGLEVYFELAQNVNSEYNINQALIWCQRVEELVGEDEDVFQKRQELQRMSKQE